MRFAIWSPTNPRDGVTHVELFRQQIHEIEIAEELGFDHIWLYEHHVSPSGPMPSPNLLIAAAAPSTSRIRLGTMVNILPYRNPLLVAEEAAMLDVLTNGRLDMGIGRGLKPIEFDAFCVPQAHSREMFLESIEIIRRVWADENFEFHGKYFQVNKQTPLSPPLVQKPHPPFLISAQSEESLRFAAENDMPFAQIDALIEDCERDQRFYRDIQVRAATRRRAALFITREIYVAETDAQAREEANPYLLQYWDLWGRYTQFTRDGRMPDDYGSWTQARADAPRHEIRRADRARAGHDRQRRDRRATDYRTPASARSVRARRRVQVRRHAVRHGHQVDAARSRPQVMPAGARRRRRIVQRTRSGCSAGGVNDIRGFQDRRMIEFLRGQHAEQPARRHRAGGARAPLSTCTRSIFSPAAPRRRNS